MGYHPKYRKKVVLYKDRIKKVGGSLKDHFFGYHPKYRKKVVLYKDRIKKIGGSLKDHFLWLGPKKKKLYGPCKGPRTL